MFQRLPVFEKFESDSVCGDPTDEGSQRSQPDRGGGDHGAWVALAKASRNIPVSSFPRFSIFSDDTWDTRSGVEVNII